MTWNRCKDSRLSKSIRFGNHDELRALFGTRDCHIKRLRDLLRIDVVVRGDVLHLRGEDREVALGTKALDELRSLFHRNGELAEKEVDQVLERIRSTHDTSGLSLPSGAVEVFHKDRSVRALSPGQEVYIEAVKKNDLVLCTGPAGSGKTYLAVAMAVNALRKELVRKIVLVRPAVEAGEKLGFLPGDMFAKVNPYLKPLLDALTDILDVETVQRYIEKEVVEIVPLAFMRGRTLNNTFIILDEAQNTTTTQMKMFLTRMGHHSKIVVTGDMTQVDLPDHVPSGLPDAIRRLQNVPGVAALGLTGVDIVRHPLVRKIVEAYDDQHSSVESAGEFPNLDPVVNGHARSFPEVTGSKFQ